MSSSESEGFESADEIVSDIGEEELDELLADVPDIESEKIDAQKIPGGKLKSYTSPNAEKSQHTQPVLNDNDLIVISIPSSSLQVSEVASIDSAGKPSAREPVAVNTIEETADKFQQFKIEKSNETSTKGVITATTSNESSATYANEEFLSAPECWDNKDDFSNGWDFEDSDIILPETPEKKVDSPSEEKVKSDDKTDSGWPSWGSWGVSNIISSASEGVSNLSLQMTSGFTSMLETTLGAPDPHDLVKELAAEETYEEKLLVQESTGSASSDLFGLGSIIGGVSHLGSKVITGGIDTLETLGKKTMEVLQEGDPGFKKKRALLFQGEKVILSQVLRSAKEKAEAVEKEREEYNQCRKAQYETLFDDFHGLVHLEALEMISKQCEIKLNSLLSTSTNSGDIIELNEISSKVKCLFDQQQFHEDGDKPFENNLVVCDKLSSAVNLLQLNINLNYLVEVDSSINSRMSEKYCDATEIHVKAISDLAQFTACSIELFHRIAELIILKGSSNYENDFKSLVSVTFITKGKIGIISENYSSKIMRLSDKKHCALVTNIFLEATNSGTYLENAFDLFLPILQLKALKD